jgi:hypothetical protein
MNYCLDHIKDYFELKYLTNLKQGSTKINCESNILNSNIENLIKKNIILHDKEKELDNENSVSNENITETDILSENIDYLFLKPWNKLNQIHKIIKIKEFVNNLKTNTIDKDNIKEILINSIKNKKKLKLSYDDNKGKIISISNLSFINNKYNIENN